MPSNCDNDTDDNDDDDEEEECDCDDEEEYGSMMYVGGTKGRFGNACVLVFQPGRGCRLGKETSPHTKKTTREGSSKQPSW